MQFHFFLLFLFFRKLLLRRLRELQERVGQYLLLEVLLQVEAARRHAVEGPNERTWSELDRHFREEAAREPLW